MASPIGSHVRRAIAHTVLTELSNKLQTISSYEEVLVENCCYFSEYELGASITLKELKIAFQNGLGSAIVARFSLEENIACINQHVPFLERLASTSDDILDAISLNELRFVGHVYPYCNTPIFYAFMSDDEFCQTKMRSIGPRCWMGIANRLSRIEEATHCLDSFLFERYFLLTPRQYLDLLWQISLETSLFVVDRNYGIFEIQTTHEELISKIHTQGIDNLLMVGLPVENEALISALFHFVDQTTIGYVGTKAELSSLGKIRHLSTEQFTEYAHFLPSGFCHLASLQQLRGLDFSRFSPESREALVRGGGDQNTFMLRLEALSEEQCLCLSENATDWVRANVPFGLSPNASLANLTQSMMNLRV